MHQYGAATHVGNIRDNNEDSYVCDGKKGLWIVADGMGGLGFGEVASAITTYTVTKMIGEGHGVNQAIEFAHSQIKAYAESDGMGTNMGTTIVLLLSHGSLYNIFWVGDSRAYLLDKGEIRQVTVDHSLVQSLVDQGEITPEEAETDPRKNAVTRALGVQELETVRADSVSDKWKPGQKILLCSDGLTDCVSKSEIQAILQKDGTDQELTNRLIQAALEGGGKDNVTVIIVSAAPGTKFADSDTHVPDGTKDDTADPSSDDTGQRNARNDFKGNQGGDKQANARQLELTMPETTKSIATLREVLRQRTSGPLGLTKKSKALLAIAASLLLAILITMSNIGPGKKPAKPAEFSQREEAPAFNRREFPAIDLPLKGLIIQVGVFARLEGAEEKQIALSQLGLDSYVQKRSTEHGLLYAVLLGPLSAESHQSTVATLMANNFNHFHPLARGS